MNNIGIIGAMEEEINQIRDLMEQVEVKTIASMDFYNGIIGNKNIIVVRSGIGKVNAAICTQILINQYQVEGIINTGIAGSLKNEINIGDMVLSTDSIQHDVDVRAFGHDYGVIPRMESSIFIADKNMLQTAKDACKRVNPDINVYSGRILSGDQFVQNKEKKIWLTSYFQGLCVEMEGAAIAQAASLNHVPFLIVRAISDKADDSANMDYDKFEAKAIQHSLNLLLEMISIL